jgi:hypothetical protein
VKTRRINEILTIAKKQLTCRLSLRSELMLQVAVSRDPPAPPPPGTGVELLISGIRGVCDYQKPFPVALEILRPTQMAVGMRAVESKRRKIERRAKSRRRLRNYLEERPVPAIRGPGEGFFIIDRHHLSLALWQSDVDEAFVTLVGDLSHLPRERFLRQMASLGLLYAYDGHGRPISPTQLPVTLGALRCDPYRDLAWSVRRAGGFQKTNRPYAEFCWANFFRTRIPRATVRSDFGHAHDRAMRLARSQAAQHMPGYLGR